MVDGATFRNAATSWVVHQSSGRSSATGFRLQRSRCLAASGALGPDDCHRDAAFSRFADDISCAAISPRGLAVPDGKEPVCAAQHGIAGFHVGVFGRFDAVEPVDVGGPGQERVVCVV